MKNNKIESNTTFNRLYSEYHPKVYRLCLGYVAGDETIADDIAQEVFVKVWQKLDTFREESKISTWIYRIAVNSCLMHLRKIKKLQEQYTDNMPDDKHNSDDNILDDRISVLRSCMNKLNEVSKLLMTLVLEEVEQKEIANIVGLTHENVRVKVHRCKGRLFKCITSKGL